MNIRPASLSLVVLGVALWAGCKSPSSPSSRPSARVSAPGTVDRQADAYAHYAAAISYDLNDKPGRASAEYYASALASPGNLLVVQETVDRLLEDGQPAQASQVLTNAISLSKPSSGLFALLARTYLLAGKTNLAEQAVQLALKYPADSPAASKNLAAVCLDLKRPQDALRVLEQAAQKKSGAGSAPLELIELFGRYQQQRPQDADRLRPHLLALYRQAANQKNQNLAVLQKIADGLGQYGDMVGATGIYTNLIAQYGNYPIFRDGLRDKLVNLYLRADNKEKAAEQLQAMVRDNPTKYPQSYYLLASFAFEKKDFVRAAEYFGKAITVGPEFEQAYYDLAGCQVNLNQPAEALATLERARERFNPNFVMEFYSGLAHQRLKNFSTALKYYTQAEVIANTSATNRLDFPFYFQIAACYERNQDFATSEKYFEKALKLRPNEPEALNYLGYMWAERGTNLPAARKLIEKALAAQPENAAYLDSMAWVLYQLKQPEKALPILHKAEALLKEPDPTMLDHLGDIYHALGQAEKARDCWQRSLNVESNQTIRKKLGLPL